MKVMPTQMRTVTQVSVVQDEGGASVAGAWGGPDESTDTGFQPDGGSGGAAAGW